MHRASSDGIVLARLQAMVQLADCRKERLPIKSVLPWHRMKRLCNVHVHGGIGRRPALDDRERSPRSP